MGEFFRKVKKDHLFYTLLLIYVAGLFLLSFLRDMVSDEALYLHETFLISELFRAGTWIGPYGVGIHGILFKIPPALIFLLTGPSVAIVTIYNIILTALVGVLSYKLFSHILKNKVYGILSTTILLSNFHFFLSAGTFLREIPSILVILLLLNHIILHGKTRNILLGLLFLLLLDAKEYIFAIYAVFYVIWLFIDSDQRNILKRCWDVTKQSFFIFLPSLIWIILMFTTHIIPVNMFVASIIGLKDNTFGYLVSHFDVETSTHNALEGGRNIFLILIQETWHPIFIFLASTVNTILSYIGKVMYPRVFSFLSIPKVVILPVVASSILTLKQYLFTNGGTNNVNDAGKKKSRKKEKRKLRNYALLCTLILTWLTIYILRASHGRYLLPIVPAITVIYVYFLFKQKLSIKQKRNIFLATVLYVSFGVYFETSYVIPKIVLEFSILTLFLTMILKPHLQYVKYLLIVLLATGCVTSALLFSYIQGQIHGYMNFGANRNVREIAQLIPEEGRYWINSPSNQHVLSVYNNETYLNPEWKWRLHELVPIRDSLKVYGQEQSFSFLVKDMEIFRENVENYDIDKVVMIVTQVDHERYPDQECLEDFLSTTFLKLDNKVKYKGMDVYIFKVVK